MEIICVDLERTYPQLSKLRNAKNNQISLLKKKLAQTIVILKNNFMQYGKEIYSSVIEFL